MINIEEGVYVSILESMKGPEPYPLQNGFSKDKEYRVLGIYNASETSEAYMILSNDENELWFISNRHVRFSGIYKNTLKPSIERYSEARFKTSSSS